MKRRLFHTLGWVFLVLIVMGVVAPFLHADRYRGRVEAALSSALGRKVEIGDLRLDLFTGPGFSASNVTIGDSGANAEPFAYVGELRAVPRLLSLWTGHLEFASLTLEDAHVNLARTSAPDGTPLWNFEPLLRPRLLAAFPTIRLRGARINFKMANVKNLFYLLNTDLDVSPRTSDGSDWELRFTGEPARSDRPAHGFGAIAASGRWRQAAGGSGLLELDAKLDRSEIGDMVALVIGHDAGVHGLISGQVHVAGPVQDMGVEGEVRVSELHGWDQSPPAGGVFVFRVSGTANTGQQHLELFAEPRGGQTPVKAHLTADGYLQRPVWGFNLHADALPVASLPGLFRNFGASIPEDLRLAGSLQGDLHYAAAGGWKGAGSIRDAFLTIRNFPVLTFEQAALEVTDGTARLLPVKMVSGTDTIGTLAGHYALAEGSFEVDLASAGGPFAGLLKTFPVASVPLLSRLSYANWSGDLRYIQTVSTPGRWTGSGELSKALAQIPALAQPLQILHASVQIDGEAIRIDRMDVRAGELEATGDYRYVPEADRPHQFHIAMQSADASQLEALFRPVLRRSSNLFDLALTLGRATIPDWLRGMHADGSIQVNTLTTAGSDLTRVRSRLLWDGPQIVFTDWQSRHGQGVIAGRLTVDLRETAPQYLAIARLNGITWQGGRVDGNVRLKTSGMGLQVLSNLNASGTFQAHDLNLEPVGSIESVAGTGEMSWSGNAPVFRFPEVRVASEGDTWTGTGASRGSDGEVVFQLSGNGKQKNLAGSLTDPAHTWTERQ